MVPNKKILVTGADGGLGIPVVNKLLSSGWQVWAFLHSDEKSSTFKQEFPDEELGKLSIVTGDINDADDIRKAVAQIGIPDALVHLAGGFSAAPSLAEEDETIFDKMFNLNTRSTFLLLKMVLPVMKQNNKGSIVAIGAKPAVHVGAVNAVYAASKAALINLVLTAAEEGRKNNVRANVIAPAVIKTDANMQWGGSKEEAAQWTKPEEIANVIHWLVSDESKEVTGTVIPMYHNLYT